ncbi:hypothetical protein N431DRAFT_428517 [Stipitochalara longipes BDJ]|nr:hypothetical protein N431DRAFT_428517 [Stipitochalara longipes BDJ]
MEVIPIPAQLEGGDGWQNINDFLAVNDAPDQVRIYGTDQPEDMVALRDLGGQVNEGHRQLPNRNWFQRRQEEVDEDRRWSAQTRLRLYALDPRLFSLDEEEYFRGLLVDLRLVDDRITAWDLRQSLNPQIESTFSAQRDVNNDLRPWLSLLRQDSETLVSDSSP